MKYHITNLNVFMVFITAPESKQGCPNSISKPNKYITSPTYTWMELLVWSVIAVLSGVSRHLFTLSQKQVHATAHIPNTPHIPSKVPASSL